MRSRQALVFQCAEIQARMNAIGSAWQGRPFPESVRNEWDFLKAELGRAKREHQAVVRAERELRERHEVRPHEHIAIDAPTCLYRFYDRAGRLLYVGITRDPQRRFNTHAARAAWWAEIGRLEVEWFMARRSAAEAEAAAIEHEDPAYNVLRPRVMA